MKPVPDSSPRIVFRLLLTAMLVFAFAEAHAGVGDDVPGWQLQVAEHTLGGDLDVRETIWVEARPPGGPYDRIGLHRYRGSKDPFATVLYLPGTNMNGVAVPQNESHNLWLYLAARGVDVFTLDYRTHAIPPETPPEDLGALKQWNTAVFLGDIKAAARQVRQQGGRKEIFLAGFSRGGVLSYAYALENPRHLAGLVILDAPFKNHTPKGKYDADTALKKLQASGLWASDVGGSHGWASRERLMQAVAADPTAKLPSGDYATVGDLLTHVLQTAWGNGGLANPAGGVSKIQVLAQLMQSYDRYYPAIQDVEQRSIADHSDDPRTPIDDHWGRIHAPVLAFASTGLGREWTSNVVYSATSSGSKDVTTHVLDGYGHLDVLVANKAESDVFLPLLKWLCIRSGRNATCSSGGR